VSCLKWYQVRWEGLAISSDTSLNVGKLTAALGNQNGLCVVFALFRFDAV
jgi:hypothetical protein